MEKVTSAIIAELHGNNEYTGRSVPVKKTFEMYGRTFYVVKCTSVLYRAIEAETGAPVGLAKRTISGACKDAIENMKRGNRPAMLKEVIAGWIKTYGKATDLSCSTASL